MGPQIPKDSSAIAKPMPTPTPLESLKRTAMTTLYDPKSSLPIFFPSFFFFWVVKMEIISSNGGTTVHGSNPAVLSLYFI